MSPPLVTVVVVPRESFSNAPTSLQSVLANTGIEYEFVYIDGKSPRRVARRLRAALSHRDVTYVRFDRYLSPNEARNLALPYIRTDYVAFVDNDVLVEPGWLEQLLVRAEREGAWVVGGLEFQGEPGREEIHTAGGDISFSGEDGRRWMDEAPRHQGELLSDVGEALVARACDVVEFHSVLVRTDVFEAIGPLDDRLLSTREHVDLCLQVARAGGRIWFEPASRITFPRGTLRPMDLAYFSLRWSERWTRASMEHFVDKYGIDPAYGTRRLSEVGAYRTWRYVQPIVEVARSVLPVRVFEVAKRAATRVERWIHRWIVH